MADHNMHRERVRKRFLKTGLNGMHDHEVLELLLFYAIARKDTKVLAYRLLESFGSLNAVLEAPVEELKKVDGIGENSAVLISLAVELFRRYELNRAHEKDKEQILDTTEKIGAYVAPFFIGQRDEIIMLACMDHKARVLSMQEIGRGSVNDVNVSIRKIAEIAMRFNAYGVIMAHNHPNGFALPSRDDITTTNRVDAGLRAIGVAFIDHIVVGDSDFVSMRESGMFDYNY